MLKVFQAAVFCRRWRVLGKDLLPLSLGHIWFLDASDNAFVAGNKPPTISDVIMVASICSRTWAQNMAAYANPAREGRAVAAWSKKCKDIRIRREIKSVDGYIEDHAIMPEMWSSGGNDGKAKHPWYILMYVRLTRDGVDGAMDMPLPLAMSLWSAGRELDGDRSLISDEEKEIIDHLKELPENG